MYPYNLEQNELKIMADSKEVNNYEKADRKILDLLFLALKDEKEDAYYYEQLMKKIKDGTDKQILRQMSLDEQKHYKYFAQIYKRLTGNEPMVRYEQADITNDFSKEFSQALFNELEAVELYRRLMFLFLDLEIRDMLYEIITDEQIHASKLNYLCTKYEVMEHEA